MNLEQQMSAGAAESPRLPSWKAVLSGLAVGVLAGIGVVALSRTVGLARRYRGATLREHTITIALYAIGGLAAGAVASYLDRGARVGSHELGASEDELGQGTLDGTTWITAVELRAPGNLDETGGAM